MPGQPPLAQSNAILVLIGRMNDLHPRDLFEAARHEALMQSGATEGEPVVGDVLRQGYTLKGRVIRPAGVKVVRK